jgi:hypothetical protein
MKQFNLETQEWEGEDAPPLTSLGYLQSIYRDENQSPSMRIRCAVEALPYENPRVSAITVTSMSGQSFAEALERAIERSKQPVPLPPPKVIEAEQVSASHLKRPFSNYRNNYRRY